MPTILIIDDDKDFQDIYGRLLTEKKHTVLQAMDGKSGFLMAKETPPDLIILDIMLPQKMNGFDVLEGLKKDHKLKKIPVIVVSNIETEEQMARKMGANEYFVKVNTTPEVVLSTIDNYLH